MADAREVKARLRAQIAAIESGRRPLVEEHGEGRPTLDGPLSPSDPVAAAAARLDELAKRKGAASARGSESREPFGVAGESPVGDAPADLDGTAAGEGEAAESERAFRKIERLALMREQASASLRARLAHDGFSEQASSAAVDRAVACGLVDDARYAEVLVRSRVSQGRGAQGISAELEGLGIDIAVVPGWPDEFPVDRDSEVERALALLDRKPPRAKNKRDAAYRRLAQKGFGASVSSTAARLWTEAHPD
ncbi:recombinase RecX [Gordonibacter sp. 28C]|uniref:regulatory protein RecX n=1 Tax=Gordonibacter sp. 28C TaxID=2078569 RepID=UPI000DF74833|nr:regulatory protein RecX [Gordonibacter sp. 28C]RDB62364.1 recombinase RecX [Gordonibacter sp. 28C]